MIVIAEPICTKYSHAPFNAALIEIVARTNSTETILFVAEAEHVAEVRKLCEAPDSVVTWIPLGCPKARYVSGKVLNRIRFFRRALDNMSCRRLIVSAADVATIHAVTIIRRFGILKFNDIDIVLHAVLAELWGWQPRNPLYKIDRLPFALQCAPSDISYIVLDHHIARELQVRKPNLNGRLRVLPHPITNHDWKVNQSDCDLIPPVHFGFLGAATLDKGFDVFLDIAAEVKSKLGDKVIFSAIGPLRMPVKESRLWPLKRRPTAVGMPRTAFLQAALEIDYALLPLGPGYAYIASGSVLDAIALGKPIVAPKLPGFADLVSRYGPIGHFAEVNRLGEVVHDLASEPNSVSYRQNVTNISRVAEARQPRTLAATIEI